MRLKAMVRRLVPDRVMARVRLHQHSRTVRVNVDVFVEQPAQARRWLAVTPDTYRVRQGPLPRAAGPYATTPHDRGLPVVLARPDADRADIEIALGVLGAGLDAAVVARCRPPGLVDRRRAEPVVAPDVVALAPRTIRLVPGVAELAGSLEAVVDQLRAAGVGIGLVPRHGAGRASTARTDRIEADPWVVLSAVPMHDIGGGSRSAQLALELLRRDAHVVYVALYGAQESGDLGLRFVDDRLEQHGVLGLGVAGIVERAAAAGTVIVEAPAPELASIAVAFGAAGWTIVYDMIDDWSDPALGGEWYLDRVERELAVSADLVIASAPDLVRRAEAMGSRGFLVPNAVNTSIFAGEAPAPPELQGEERVVIGYHGSLYGDWFDWDALRRVAEAFPQARLVVIGDDKGHPPQPGNVEFFGLRPQYQLPGYVQAMAVGLVPFRVTDATHAVSPLKAYEYLASGVPVAAPPLRSLRGLDGVHTDDDLVAAVRAALAAPRPDRVRALAEHGWPGRVDAIYTALGRRPAPTVRAGAAVATRPVVRYARRDRLIRSS